MKMKGILSIILTLCMVLSMLPVGALAACAHEYVTEIYPATCTEGGFTVFTCSLCGDAYIGDEVEPLNHPEYVDGFCVLCGSGQPAVENGDYYEISNVAQLYWFAEQVNSGNTDINGKLMNDIVVNENVLKEDGTLNGDGSNFKVWTPIGNDVKKFAGTFDGNGNTVSGLYINTGNDYVGLFGYVDSGCIQNVGVVDSYLSGYDYVGGVLGYSDESLVSNCYNTGSVSGDDRVGGVVGCSSEWRIICCYNTGNISGCDYVGGVVGYATSYKWGNYYITVSDCYNAGSVRGSYDVGGVVGYNYYGAVSGCYNTGSVSGNERVGGVVSYNFYGTVSNSYNTGSVSGSDYVGGVAGYNYDGTVSGCYNTGSVSGTLKVGGVVGKNSGSVSNCYNTGSVDGVEPLGRNIGGVVGENSGAVSECYNTGNVSLFIYVGGVVGCNNGGTVSNCYNTGSVSGYDYVGGVVGYNDSSSTVKNCFYRTGCAKDESNKIQFGIGCETVGSNVRDTAGVTIGKSTDTFASGEVAYLLQGEQTDPIWGQEIGVDPSPVLNGQPVHFIYGEYTNEVCQHEYQAVVTQPTCTVGGYTTYTCIACGESHTGDVTATAPHSLVDGLCSVCGNRVIYFYNADEWSIVNYYAWYTPYNVVSNAWPGSLMTKVEGEVYSCAVPVDLPNIIFNNTYNQTADLIVPLLASGKNFYDYGSGTWCVYTSDGAHHYVNGQCTICGAEQPFVGVSVSGNVTSYLEGDTTVELIQDGEVVYSVTVSGGEYTIEGVVAGEYTLRISKANHAPVEMAITVGEEAVTQDATICPIGDVTGDGNVNIKDFQRLLRHVNKTNPLTDYELACGDVTGDGNCNIKDFQRLLRHVNKTNPLF